MYDDITLHHTTLHSLHNIPLGDVQVCHQMLSSAFDLLLTFLCSLIQTLTLTPPSNNALLANMDTEGGP